MKRKGLARILAAFEQSRQSHKAALMPYFTLGYPDEKTSIEVIKAIAPYSHLIELGVPFSDPIADGPTIQRSTQIALDQGMTSTRCLAVVKNLRDEGIETPFLLMGYYNPILAYGERQYVIDAATAGADGLIVPDLPIEESGSLEQYTKNEGMALIHFLAPTSNSTRIHSVIGRARGFIYMVSLTGVTGARETLDLSIERLVREIKAESKIPVAVGFGISNARDASKVATFADGIIVGSALVNSLDMSAADKCSAPTEFVHSLWTALQL